MNVACLKCRWISFPVTKAYAEAEIKRFNDYYDKLSKDDKRIYYGNRSSTISDYTCLKCGGDKFRPATDEEMKAIYGSTINPVIYEGET